MGTQARQAGQRADGHDPQDTSARAASERDRERFVGTVRRELLDRLLIIN
jgi:hypothetical protein